MNSAQNLELFENGLSQRISLPNNTAMNSTIFMYAVVKGSGNSGLPIGSSFAKVQNVFAKNINGVYSVSSVSDVSSNVDAGMETATMSYQAGAGSFIIKFVAPDTANNTVFSASAQVFNSIIDL